ncbi:SprT protein [Pseudomonas pohangensis]|jgi:SprT protein|uniref:Protein SprT n=1 Tax=Pseudomonas pohangensis TaxID=364197 RepID=A0A1H2EFV2_9PSED|nr:SprT family zinc-dependent metalloprotease [Pseudomonas pohangensis]SDT94006.1 SprT protein [Pseudomonas pohangensis]
MHEQIQKRVETCYQQAERFFQRTFSRPEVSLQLRGQKAGVAHLQENKLRFNPQLYRENQDDFLRQTVAHEVAHLIAHSMFGSRIRPHGAEWQQIMRGVYQLPPLRCHNYAVQRRAVTRYIYRCQCLDGEFPFTSRRHAMVKRGQRYQCRRCNTQLLFSGESRCG